MSKRAIGGYVFNQEITRARNNTSKARDALRQILEGRPGPQTVAFLVASAAVALGELEAIINEIDSIAREQHEPIG
jgi:predicted Zn-dependent protease